MSTNDTYLAVFLGSKTSPRMTAWNALPEAERLAKQREGIAAWKAWSERHQAAIVGMGGPLGKSQGHSGYQQRHGGVYGRARGFPRSRGQVVRTTSTLYDLSR
jgi:hypothetical protein